LSGVELIWMMKSGNSQEIQLPTNWFTNYRAPWPEILTIFAEFQIFEVFYLKLTKS
jgi:hypothetical protein